MSTSQKKNSIVIIGENRFIRKGWELILNETPDFIIVALCRDFGEACKLDMIAEAKFVLGDLCLKPLSGIEGIRALHQRYPVQQHFICTVHEDDPCIFDAILAGAVSFINSKTTPEYFIRILRDSAEGRSPMTPVIAGKIKALGMRGNLADNRPTAFTSQETNIIDSIANGKSYQSIAREQTISVNEVTVTIRAIYKKIQGSITSIA